MPTLLPPEVAPRSNGVLAALSGRFLRRACLGFVLGVVGGWAVGLLRVPEGPPEVTGR